MSFEEAYDRLMAGWHVDLEEADALCSAQRKRYLRLERERLVRSAADQAIVNGVSANDCLAVCISGLVCTSRHVRTLGE